MSHHQSEFPSRRLLPPRPQAVAAVWPIAFLSLLLAGCGSGEAPQQGAAPQKPVADAAPTPAPVASTAPVPTQEPEPTGPMRLGEMRSFGVGGGANSFLESGWSGPEPGFIWSDGTEAAMRIPVVATDQALWVRLKAHGLTLDSVLPVQRVSVAVNDRPAADWQIGGSGLWSFPVPAGKGEVRVRLALPDAKSPSELGLSADGRKLALCLQSITLEPFPVLSAPYRLDFRPNGNATTYQMEGWDAPGEDGTWTTGMRAALIIPVPAGVTFKSLRISFTPFVGGTAGAMQQVLLRINRAAEEKWIAGTAVRSECVIPPGSMSDGLCRLDFEFPGATPEVPGDPRLLGIKVTSIELVPATR